MHCIPIGTPTTVIKQMSAAKNHSIERIAPPKIIHKTFPSVFIAKTYAVAFDDFIGIIAFSNTIANASIIAYKI